MADLPPRAPPPRTDSRDSLLCSEASDPPEPKWWLLEWMNYLIMAIFLGSVCYHVQQTTFAPKLQRDATEATDSGGELSGSELSGGELSDEGILRRKVGRRAVGADTVLYAGVGYFERDARHTPPQIPPSPEAARAALDSASIAAPSFGPTSGA